MILVRLNDEQKAIMKGINVYLPHFNEEKQVGEDYVYHGLQLRKLAKNHKTIDFDNLPNEVRAKMQSILDKGFLKLTRK